MLQCAWKWCIRQRMARPSAFKSELSDVTVQEIGGPPLPLLSRDALGCLSAGAVGWLFHKLASCWKGSHRRRLSRRSRFLKGSEGGEGGRVKRYIVVDPFQLEPHGPCCISQLFSGHNPELRQVCRSRPEARLLLAPLLKSVLILV